MTTQNWYPPAGVDQALGQLRKKMYVLEMARWKPRIKPATKQRMMVEVIEAAKAVGKING